MCSREGNNGTVYDYLNTKGWITMKKLFSLAKTDILSSLLPILMWLLAAMVYTDTNIMETLL